jgi:FtsZ-binding cell division protein ZapB
MINLEQIKLLEAKVGKTVDYVERLSGENAALRRQESELNKKILAYQKRINELEILIVHFKEDQSRIEDGILSALNRLNQFEEVIEKSLTIGDKNAAAKTAPAKTAAKTPKQPPPDHGESAGGGADEKICFELPVSAGVLPENEDDLLDPLIETLTDELPDGELDIF